MKTFKVSFEYLAKMELLELIPTSFDVEIGNADIASHLEEESIDMTVDLKACDLFRRKGSRKF